MKNIVALILLISSFIVPAFSQDSPGIEFTIRYFDKAIYFPDSRILVRVEIHNNSAQTYRFKASPKRAFNLDFSVKTISNEPIEHAEEFIIDRNSDQAVLYRDFSLEPGERYATVEDITRFVKITRPGVYVVSANYFPELYTDPQSRYFTSNMLTLSVHAGSMEEEPEIIIDRDTGEALTQLQIPPDEVIEYTLSARQKGDWNKFFLYIDIEGMYIQDGGRESSYKRWMSDAERRTALSTYKESLVAGGAADEFVMLPTSFEVVKTSYTPTEAGVIVIEKFAYTDYTEVKRFTYYLRRRDRIWTIFDYEVQNLRTE